tara:strand:+ start:465 stop:692 length:228 start_codon:yes stop_codon:yes gene_type:complete
MNEIESMIKLLLITASRLQDYIDNGIEIETTKPLVDDYRIDSAESRIESRKRQTEKDRKLIKQIKAYAKRRKSMK